MNITDVKVTKFEKMNRLKGIAVITIDDCFVLHDIKVIEGKDEELFIAMPSKKLSDGKWVDIAHPINQETRDKLTDIVLSAYHEVK